VREYLHPNSEHVIDWFHVTMRLTVLQQQTKALAEKQPEDAAVVSKQLESVKHLLWHGNVEEALERLTNVLIDLDLIPGCTSAEKLTTGIAEFETYIRNNQESIPNYGERYRQRETISTAFTPNTPGPPIGGPWRILSLGTTISPLGPCSRRPWSNSTGSP
jgi:hypothetical protein